MELFNILCQEIARHVNKIIDKPVEDTQLLNVELLSIAVRNGCFLHKNEILLIFKYVK